MLVPVRSAFIVELLIDPALVVAPGKDLSLELVERAFDRAYGILIVDRCRRQRQTNAPSDLDVRDLEEMNSVDIEFAALRWEHWRQDNAYPANRDVIATNFELPREPPDPGSGSLAFDPMRGSVTVKPGGD